MSVSESVGGDVGGSASPAERGAPPPRSGAAQGPGGRRPFLILAVTCAVMFLDSLDTSTVGVALPNIQDDLSMSTTSLQWLVSGYTISYGGLLLVGGKAADLLGRRRVLVWGLGVFVVASVVGGLMTEPTALIASRFAKGMAAAFTAPAAFSILTTEFREGPERNRAVSAYGATAGLGFSTGLVASGLLTEISWRMVFIIPGLLGLVLLVLVPLVIRPDTPRPAGARRSFDPGGGLLVTSALVLFVLALVQAAEYGWGAVATLGPLLVSAVLAVLFVVVESRHRAPMLPLEIFRSRVRSASYLVAVLHGAAAIGWQFAMVLYFQEVLDYGAVRTALAMIPIGVAVFVTAQFATPRLVGRFGTRAVCLAGLVLQAGSLAWFAQVGHEDRYLTLTLPTMVLHAVAGGLVYSAANIGGVSGVANERQGLAAGLCNSAYVTGTGLGTAILAGVIATTTGDAAAPPLAAFQHAFLAGAALAAAGLLVALVGLPHGARIGAHGGPGAGSGARAGRGEGPAPSAR